MEACAIFRKALGVAQVHKKFTAAHEAHDEENLLGRLKNVAHADEEGMVSFQQNIFLEFG